MTILRYRNLILGLLLAIATGCSKQNDAPAGPQVNGSSIAYVLNDNFTFSKLHDRLAAVGLIDTLAGTRPFTILAPNNDAFQLKAYVPPSLAWVTMAYHILPDSIAFGPMPLVQNKPLMTLAGKNVYFSKFVEAGDTVTAVNGFRLVSLDNPASNGLIQVMPGILLPEVYPTLDSRMRNDTILNYFCLMLQRTGLDSLLSGSDVYTVLAPSNAALRATAGRPGSLDLSSFDRILGADVDSLRNMVRYSILRDRNFLGDLYHSEYTQPDGITMLNGENVGVTGSPASYRSIQFAGKNGGAAGIYTYSALDNNADIPCGNGVLHILNQVLIP